MNLVIEDNVPMPDGDSHGWGISHVLRSMKVGQSVLISGKKPESVRSIIQLVQRGSQTRFVTRSVDGGLRVWRKE